jgi:phage-related protein
LKIQVSEVESPEDYSMKERTVNLITIVIEGTKHAIQNIQQIITDLISEIIQLLIKIYQHIQEFIG